ncbi:MAG: archaeosortase/exosortase family protein [Saprospiraceae bacterium]
MAKKNKENKNISASPKTVTKKKESGFVKKVAGSLAEYWNQKSPVLKFLLGFAACMIVFYIIYLSPFFVDYIGRPILAGQAKISSFLLNILGQGTTANNDLITSSEYSISIKNGCDGLETLAIMLSGIVVFPIAFRLKWPGILYGTLALMVLNFIRIVALFIVGKNFSSDVFDFLHEQGGFVIFTVLGVFLWIIWANWALNKRTELTADNEPNTPTT